MRLMGLFLLVLCGVCHAEEAEQCVENRVFCPWLAYYGPNQPPEVFRHYNLIIVKPENFPSPPKEMKQNKILCAYVSLGQISKNQPFFEEARQRGVLLYENPDLPDTFYIDLRQEGWMRLLLDKMLPSLFIQGFNGLMLDKLDTAASLENGDPELYKGMMNAAAQLVQLIRIYFPNIYLMLANADYLLADTASFIHGFICDSFCTYYDTAKKIYSFVPQETYKRNVLALHQAVSAFPHLQLFSIDYWDARQTSEIARIYSIERSNGIRPYVGPERLESIIPEPKR
jgi:uncharacterized protein (TIGR01370 family)